MTQRGDELKAMDREGLINEIMRLEVMLEQQMKAAPGVGPTVDVHGIVGMKDGRPIVQMRSGEAAWEMSPGEARSHALMTIDASVEAERDAATIAFLRERGMDLQEVGGFLLLMRDHRKDWMGDFRKASMQFKEF